MAISSLLFFAFKAEVEQYDTLYWSASHRLTFADFRGRAEKQTAAEPERPGEGRIAGTIIKSIVADTRRVNGRLYFVVYASMKPALSWITKKNDSTALRHEQGHFDICEIYVRRLRKIIGSAVTVDEAKKMWNQELDLEESEQGIYDRDNSYTGGGITGSWTRKIQNQLKELDNYSRAEVPADKVR